LLKVSEESVAELSLPKILFSEGIWSVNLQSIFDVSSSFTKNGMYGGEISRFSSFYQSIDSKNLCDIISSASLDE